MFHPSMKHITKQDTMSQVKGGLRRAGAILFFLLIAGLFFGGVIYAFFPSGHSRILGWAFIIVSAMVMVAEMSRWVRVLPAILGLAVLNGLISLATGHALNNPSAPISRLDMLVVTLFFAACSVLARTFTGRGLALVDRASLMVFAFTLPLWMGHDATRTAAAGKLASQDRLDLVIGAVALCCLLVPWVYDRIRNSHRPKHPSASAPGAVRFS